MFEPQRAERIKWDESEKKAIVNAAVDVRWKRPTADMMRIVAAAVATLPEHRRRAITSLQAIPWFELAFRQEIERKQGLVEVQLKELTEATAKLAEVEAWNEKLQNRNTELEDDARQLRLKMETGTVDQIDDILSRTSLSQLISATHFKVVEQTSVLFGGLETLLEKVSTIVEGTNRVEAGKPKQIGKAKKRIAIAGGTSAQFRLLTSKYLNKADFKHIDTSHSSRAMSGLPIADKVFVFGNFTDKSTHENLVSHYGRPKITIINGGITLLASAVSAELS